MRQYFVLDKILIYAFGILQSYLMKSDLITKHTLSEKMCKYCTFRETTACHGGSAFIGTTMYLIYS